VSNLSLITQHLMALGIALPKPAAPMAAYVPFVRTGNQVFISGQLPIDNGKLTTTGKLGENVTLEAGRAAARLCGLNILAQLEAACGGNLDRVAQCVRLGGFVASAPDFYDQPKVANGASELMQEVFGRAGQHARSAIGVPCLPLNAAVEVDALFTLKD
jgi:enamine deaminase RidA (YjgF/YER057c/UK114 family)